MDQLFREPSLVWRPGGLELVDWSPWFRRPWGFPHLPQGPSAANPQTPNTKGVPKKTRALPVASLEQAKKGVSTEATKENSEK